MNWYHFRNKKNTARGMLPSPWCNHRRWGSGWVETASGTFISQGLISVFSICICLLWNVENNILYPQFRLVLKQWRAQWGCDHSPSTSYLWGNVQSWEELYHSKWLNLPISLIYILNMSHPFTNCGRGVDFYLRDNPSLHGNRLQRPTQPFFL